MINSQKLSAYAPLLLRVGLSALFIWFGLSQLLDTNSWLSWVPEWALAILPLSAKTIVLLNGGVEFLGGVLLAFGVWTRWVALILGLHLVVIAFDIGLTAIGVRDFALSLATLALSLFGRDEWSFL